MIRGAPATGPPLFLSPEKEEEAERHTSPLSEKTYPAKRQQRFIPPIKHPAKRQHRFISPIQYPEKQKAIIALIFFCLLFFHQGKKRR